MKSQKGVTLTALVLYMCVFVIVLGIVTTISDRFFKSVGAIKESPEYVAEFNKFSMFFIQDVKKNSSIKTITDTSVEFEDGTKYTYQNNAIYRNKTKLAKNVKSLTFTKSEYVLNDFTKTLINVNSILGNDKNQITRNIDFVLKYW